MTGWLDFVEAARSEKDLSALSSAFDKIIATWGFDSYAANIPASMMSGSPGEARLFVFSDRWTDHYVNNYCALVDPITLHAFRATTPFFWNDVETRYTLSKGQLDFMDDARSVGLKHGAAVPIHGHGLPKAGVSVASAHNDFRTDILAELAVVSYCLHDSIWFDAFRPTKPEAEPVPLLSTREKDCLRWLAAGKTDWEVGEILGVTERTVRFHVDNAKRKLQAKNRVHAVATAIMNGEIEP